MVNRACFFGKISEQMFDSVASWEEVDWQLHRLKDSKSIQKASKMAQSIKARAAKLSHKLLSNLRKHLLSLFLLQNKHQMHLT